ncbi:MAG: hypothetical protein ACHRXM_04945 [Isosphaerales bacterium]
MTRIELRTHAKNGVRFLFVLVGVVLAMLCTKLKAGWLVGLALATLVVSAAAALADQQTTKEGRGAPAQEAPRESVTPVVRPPDVAKLTGSSVAVIVSLPPRAELHQLLRRASSEAFANERDVAAPKIAAALAAAGDIRAAFGWSETDRQPYALLRVAGV